MASITLRLVKGSRLTKQEGDDNWSNINTEVEAATANILNKLDTTDATAQSVASTVTWALAQTMTTSLSVGTTLGVTGLSTLTGGLVSGGNVISDTTSTDSLGTTGVRWASLFSDAATITNNATIGGTLGITGLTTVGANIVSDTDSTDDLGTTSVRWANVWADDLTLTTSAVVSTMALSTGSITDTSGAISFGNENLSTTGTLNCGALTSTGIDDNATATSITIDSTDNVAINSTPVTSGANVLFQVGDTTTLSWFDGATTAFDLGTNIVNNSGYKHIETGAAALYTQFDGEHRFSGAASASAGAGATLVEGMRITSAGNVGIGQATPITKLHISAAAANVKFKMTNTNTGHTSGDGFEIQVDTSGNAYIWQREAQSMFFGTSGATAMTINSAKNIGIGATPSTATLLVSQADTGQVISTLEHTHATTPYGMLIDFSAASPDNTTSYFLHCEDSTAARTVIRSDGDVWTSDDGVLTSDRTLKTKIVDTTSKLDTLLQLKVRDFEWKKEYHPGKVGHKRIGLIAQEVEAILPDLVEAVDIARHDAATPDIRKAIRQSFTPIIIKAVQEMYEDFDSRLKALEAV